MSFEIKFINHACFQIIKEDFSILVDPWFSGKVFNNSWELLQETNIDDLDLSKLKYIFISHEHPDHLNWLTLKKIKQKCDQRIEVLMVKRNNSNISENMKKLGYDYIEFEPYLFHTNGTDNFSFTFIQQNHDSAILFKIDDKVILNKNDCEFSTEVLMTLNKSVPEIDILLNQFSLAGYYANSEDKQSLEAARDGHITDLIKTSKILRPKLTVPFASFITFCRFENKFLNEFIVNLQKVIEENKDINLFVPYYLDNIPFQVNREKTEENCQKWSNIFDQKIKKEPEKTPTLSMKDLKESFGIMHKEISIMPGLKRYFAMNALGDSFIVCIKDIGKYCKFSFSSDFIQFFDIDDLGHVPIASLYSYDLDGFFKNPWGADTMNITSCFSVHDIKKWRTMLTIRDACYVR